MYWIKDPNIESPDPRLAEQGTLAAADARRLCQHNWCQDMKMEIKQCKHHLNTTNSLLKLRNHHHCPLESVHSPSPFAIPHAARLYHLAALDSSSLRRNCCRFTIDRSTVIEEATLGNSLNIPSPPSPPWPALRSDRAEQWTKNMRMYKRWRR